MFSRTVFFIYIYTKTLIFQGVAKCIVYYEYWPFMTLEVFLQNWRSIDLVVCFHILIGNPIFATLGERL